MTNTVAEISSLGRYMMDLTYKTGDDFELANILSRIGQDLTESKQPFSVLWKSYSVVERKIISSCYKKMKDAG